MNERSEARTPSRAYVIRVHEKAIASDVIGGTFSLFDINVYALIDPRSTHSYICTALVDKKELFVEFIEYTIKVTNLLGMDWLSKHDAIVSCRRKQVNLKRPNGEFICVKSDGIDCITNIISALSAYVIDSKMIELKIKQVPVVKECTDILLKELLGLPSTREVEFVIELVPGTAAVLITPYRMALTELKELKVQLQELLDCRLFDRVCHLEKFQFCS
ncbi:uncharacterized protein LOC128034116 [Gossypium raimondii]|uniref:uncharacterized protein LOC128034116 n=1 Tax=Gossypium raimondii TaxID=29730 RepID=UPI00227A233A|nr:uncharacterized protein LOC128034116 [Gossypium raimondii]